MASEATAAMRWSQKNVDCDKDRHDVDAEPAGLLKSLVDHRPK
jgi:hypothetical protein